jgi:hypothetical protein
MLGQRINRRLLELERTAHDCGLSHAQLTALTAPSRTPDGQPAPALKLGDPCTTALLAALCLFVLTPAGVTNRRWWLGSWVSPTSSTPRPRWATISDESAARA